MSDAWKPWAAGAVVVATVGGWLFWQKEFPEPLDGAYRCSGQTIDVDGMRSSIDASAEVADGKISTGPTGADLALGRQVTSWGEVKNTSSTQFLVEISPTGKLRKVVEDPFWITCTRE